MNKIKIIHLGEKSVISKEFSEKQSEMAKFRNKLVHDYDTINKERVLLYAREAPTIFRTFGKALLDYVDSHGPDTDG